jgi:chemotaxis-related protein WspD
LAAAGHRLFLRVPPDDYIEQWTRQIAEEHPGPPTDTVAVIVFQVGEEWLALDVGCVVELTKQRVIHRIPHRSNRLLMGLVNIRGRLELCISLAALLGIEGDRPTREDCSKGFLLVAEWPRDRWVFPVDRVLGVERVPVHELGALPATVANSAKRFSQAVFTLDTRRVGYLDAERLFSPLEKAIG